MMHGLQSAKQIPHESQAAKDNLSNLRVNNQGVFACNELDFWSYDALGNPSRPTEAKR